MKQIQTFNDQNKIAKNYSQKITIKIIETVKIMKEQITTIVAESIDTTLGIIAMIIIMNRVTIILTTKIIDVEENSKNKLKLQLCVRRK